MKNVIIVGRLITVIILLLALFLLKTDLVNTNVKDYSNNEQIVNTDTDNSNAI